MSRIKKVIISFLIIILIIICIYILYQKYVYSLDEVCMLLNTTAFSSNCYIKEDVYTGNYDDFSTSTSYYIKDNLEYVVNEDLEETLYDFSNLTYIDINHSLKIIYTSNAITSEKMIPNNELKSSFFNQVESHQENSYYGNYIFLGREKVNGKKCIKFSMTDEYTLYNDVYVYYVDLETNYIVKYEKYSENEKKLSIIIYYEENIVTDENIPEFDINNYQDYEINSF